MKLGSNKKELNQIVHKISVSFCIIVVLLYTHKNIFYLKLYYFSFWKNQSIDLSCSEFHIIEI